MADHAWRAGYRTCWKEIPLWISAFRGGRHLLLSRAEHTRLALFTRQAKLNRSVAIGYTSIPSAWHDELVWLRSTGIRDVVLPIEQASSEMRRDKALAAIQNLRAEGFPLSAVLYPNPSIDASVEGWRLFCQWTLDQIGWQVERIQLMGNLESRVRDKETGLRLARFFDEIPQWKKNFPQLEFFAPGFRSFDSFLYVNTLRTLLPVGYVWNGVTANMPILKTRHFETEDSFLRTIILAGAVAALPEAFAGHVQVCLPPLDVRLAGKEIQAQLDLMVRQTVLALASGIASRVVIGVDPEQPEPIRNVLAVALQGMMRHLEGARFVRRLNVADSASVFLFEFSKLDGSSLFVGWSHNEPRLVSVPVRIEAAWNILGRSAPLLPYPKIRVTQNVVYFEGKSREKGRDIRW